MNVDVQLYDVSTYYEGCLSVLSQPLLQSALRKLVPLQSQSFLHLAKNKIQSCPIVYRGRKTFTRKHLKKQECVEY